MQRQNEWNEMSTNTESLPMPYGISSIHIAEKRFYNLQKLFYQ